jgi:AraC-like DNA-binding protein
MRHGFFIQLFFTSLLNLLIVIIGLSVYLQFFLEDSIYGEIKQQDEEILSYIQQNMDDDILAMRRTALAITLSPGFIPFDLPKDPYKAILAIGDLNKYALVSDNVSLLGIAYMDSEYAFTDKGSITKAFFHVFSLPPFEEMVSPENLEKGFMVTDNMVLFLFPYPNLPNILARGVIFIQYPREIFFDSFIRKLSEKSRFLVVYSDIGEAALFSNTTDSSAEAIRNVYASPVSGYRYEIITPLSYYTEIMRRFQVKLILAVTGFFCLGFLLNLLVARYNTRPLRKLIDQFGPPDSSVDFRSIETVLSTQKTTREQAEQDAVLVKLIQGGFGGIADLRSMSREAGLDFSHSYFAFIIVHSNNHVGSSAARVDIGPVMFYRLYQRSGENEIWVYSGGNLSFNEHILLLFRDTVYSEDPRILIAASSVSSDTAMAAELFMEALVALNHRMASVQGGGGGIIHFTDLPKNTHPENGNVNHESDVDLSNTVKQYIEMHFDDKMLSLESIAGFLGFSVGYLCRQFKQQTGTTIASAIQGLRIKEACRLLRATKLPIKDIVSKIGYMDHSSFSRSFKTKTGMAPQEYRETVPQETLDKGGMIVYNRQLK